MRLVLTGGGTGGHIYPAIALAQHALALHLADELLFIGASAGLERELVGRLGYRMELLPVGKVRGMGLRRAAAGLLGLAASLPAAASILRRFRADVVIGTGGYASAPALAAAKMQGVCTLLCEQNTIPGTTNRALARFADTVCLSFPMSSGWLPSWKAVVTGNPVRQEVAAARARRDAAAGEGPGVLVLGGSQGAQFLNTSVAAVLSELAGKHPELAVLHQAGEGRVEEAASRYAGRPGVEVVPYIDDMSAALARATLVVGRAGATSIAEIAAVGVPSLLIPFPFATDNHQEWNARALERAGAAVVLLQSEFSAARFAEEVEEILFDRKRLAAMARHARLAGRPDAAVRVLECARSRWQTDARARQGGSLGCRGAA